MTVPAAQRVRRGSLANLPVRLAAARPLSTPATWNRALNVARWALPLMLLAAWAHRFGTVYARDGLFNWLGVDFGLYWAHAAAFRSAQPWSMYDLDAIAANLQALRPYSATGELGVGPVPYLPLFAWLFTPFTLPPPPLGFALWTAVNLAAGVWLAIRARQLAGVQSLPWLLLVVLTAAPVAQALSVGQPILFLACALAECLISLRAGREVRAGLWLSVLAIKPLYGVLLGPWLIWKRRWGAVAGALAGIALLLGASALAAGVPAVLAYPQALADDAGFYGTTMVFPSLMINWRAVILTLRPTIGLPLGLGLTFALGVITLLPLWYVLRGPWDAPGRRLPAQVAMLMLAVLLAGYHSNMHGAALLVAPFAAVWGEAETSDRTRLALLATTFVGTFIPVILVSEVWQVLVRGGPVEPVTWAPLVPLLLALCLASLLWDAQPPRTRRAQAQAGV